jgi:nucleoside-diphosphate-sugar epimerase
VNCLIIGCGYIGSEVALSWSKKGYNVTVTTRSKEKVDALSKIAQKVVIIKEMSEEELLPIIASNDVILVCIGADSPEHYESAYLDTAKHIRHIATNLREKKHLIYTSSTSVYGDANGKWVDEQSPLLGKTQQSKILIETEKTYQSLENLGWLICIFRLSEIYGPNRELSQKLQRLKDQVLPGNGENFTNMIHKADCAYAIDYAMRHNLSGTFNLSDDDHPKRKELLDLVADTFNLEPAFFDPSHPSLHGGNKRVSNHKIKSVGYIFKYPHSQIN